MSRETPRRAPRGPLLAASLLAVLVLAASPSALAAPENPLPPDAGSALDPRVLRARAEQGDMRAAFLLASGYATGNGAGRDDAEAALWYRKAAEAGLAEAQYNLAVMYAAGRGVSADLARAAHWFERAAEQGLAEAQFNLGTLYATGSGVPRDEARAALWLERAAERDLAQAQYNLGLLHEHGMGVPRDARRALSWFARAADLGYEPARKRRERLLRRLAASGTAAEPVPDAARKPPPGAREAGAPAAGVAPRAVEAGGRQGRFAWVASRDPEHYTLQLASYRSLAEAERLLATLDGAPGAGIYRSVKDGGRWFSVVRGEFTSYDLAKAAVQQLPAHLRRARPWVRKVRLIHEEMR